ncbi:MAG TPA: GNAT family N-acetyltransferase [Thermoanaerobaculia bacterium]|nr:GNAT family N-acetyltransferase [Thermoanaerobaculia bacterium]
MQDIVIAPATAADVDAIRSLLATNGLGSEGLDEHWKTFVVARDGDRTIGCGGAQAYQFAALIRSIVVDADYRRNGIGRRIVRQLLDRLASRGLREFYLLTRDAEGYFKKRGFKPVDRDEVHPQIVGTSEFQSEPEEAVCMRLVMLA